MGSAYKAAPTVPQPTCAEPLRLSGVAFVCDCPSDHLPPDQHASTVRWTAPIVRASVVADPAPRSDGPDLARSPGGAADRRDTDRQPEAPVPPLPARAGIPLPAREAPAAPD